MKSLYESLLDISPEAEAKRDTAMDFFGTTAKVFKRMKSFAPDFFFDMHLKILNEEPLDDVMKLHSMTEEEMYAISTFIKYMHEKYGQRDIFLSAWSLCGDDWQMYEIHKGMDTADKKFITVDLNLYMTITPGKVDQWIAGIDENTETAWFFCTLKSMSKVEKDTWLEIMKAVERYFN